MAKTKVLISFAVTTKLICVFVFAYAKSRFSRDEVHICFSHQVCTFPPGRPRSLSDCIIIFSVLPEANVRVILKSENKTDYSGPTKPTLEPRNEKTGVLHMRK